MLGKIRRPCDQQPRCHDFSRAVGGESHEVKQIVRAQPLSRRVERGNRCIGSGHHAVRKTILRLSTRANRHDARPHVREVGGHGQEDERHER